MLALCSTRCFTISRLPYREAKIKGVQPGKSITSRLHISIHKHMRENTYKLNRKRNLKTYHSHSSPLYWPWAPADASLWADGHFPKHTSKESSLHIADAKGYKRWITSSPKFYKNFTMFVSLVEFSSIANESFDLIEVTTFCSIAESANGHPRMRVCAYARIRVCAYVWNASYASGTDSAEAKNS